jgi:hypothetical protein
LIDTGSDFRQRVMYNDFDWRDTVALMNGNDDVLDLI